MKKLLIALLFTTTAFAQGVTPQQVLEKYFDAIGGKANIEKIKDISLDVEMEVMGQKMEMSMLKKVPNKLLIIQSMGGVEAAKIIYDGEKVKVISQGTEVPVEGAQADQYKNQSSIIPEMDYLKESVKLELLPNEKIKDEDCYVMNITVGDVTLKEFYSVSTGLKVRQDVEAMQMVVVSYFTDYKDYAPGVKFATNLRQEVMGQAIDTKYTSIKINTGIADSEFEIK